MCPETTLSQGRESQIETALLWGYETILINTTTVILLPVTDNKELDRIIVTVTESSSNKHFHNKDKGKVTSTFKCIKAVYLR